MSDVYRHMNRQSLHHGQSSIRLSSICYSYNLQMNILNILSQYIMPSSSGGLSTAAYACMLCCNDPSWQAATLSPAGLMEV